VVQLTTKLVHIGLEKEIVRDENHNTDIAKEEG
jgi:hypothetical protein